MKKRIYLSPPHLEGNEAEELSRILKSNWIAPIGPDLDKLEIEIASYLKIKGTCLTNSGASALHLALILLGVKEDDYVLVQDLTHIGGVNPILYQNAIPVFIDSEKQSWNMDPAHLENAIITCIEGKSLATSSRQGLWPSVNGKKLKAKLPKAIIPVHLYGMPADMAAIKKLSEKYNIPIIEDAAEAFGSTYKGKHLGTYGEMGIFSFNGNKIITTSGGGALVSDQLSIIEKAKFLATQARDKAVHYQHSQLGYNYRMSNVLAGLGIAQLKVLEKRISSRRNNFKKYRHFFNEWNKKGFNIEFQEEKNGCFSNRWLTSILMDPTKNKGLTVENLRLALDAGNIESRPLWKPMHVQPIFEGYPFFGDGTSESLFYTGLCLPSGSELKDIDFKRIFTVLNNIFQQFT